MTELTKEQKEDIGKLGEVIAAGDPLSEFFGVDEAYMHTVEKTAFDFYSKEQYEDARVLIEGLIALDSRRYYPHLMLGEILLHEGDAASATGHLEKADELKPDDPCVKFKLAQAKIQLDAQDAGIELLEQVLELEDEVEVPRFSQKALLIIAALDPERVREARAESAAGDVD